MLTEKRDFIYYKVSAKHIMETVDKVIEWELFLKNISTESAVNIAIKRTQINIKYTDDKCG